MGGSVNSGFNGMETMRDVNYSRNGGPSFWKHSSLKLYSPSYSSISCGIHHSNNCPFLSLAFASGLLELGVGRLSV